MHVSLADKATIRESYHCDCGGRVMPGRATPRRTDYVLDAIHSFTGQRYVGCPWSVFGLPHVIDAIRYYRYYDTGNLGAFLGDDSPNITWQAVESYIEFSDRVRAKQYYEDREKRKRERESHGQ